MGDEGLELPPRNPGKTTLPDSSGAECGAPGAQSGVVDAELAELIRRWADLPKAVKAGILAMVRAGE
ncbi:hypothetical protein [Adhaeretor mobilis]|uniref:hypothetical protein n=1 Tax=Adhaeretor mobilis TaxID=1930276 RepID=UPI0011A1BEE9|nr:hypothetical protein [Adhaeretor mobilis]